MISESEQRVKLFGSEARLLLGVGPDPQAALSEAVLYLQDFQSRLSRFNPESELVAVNNSQKTVVPVSPLLYRAISVALQAAELSGGLIDPTVLKDLQRAGYQHSWSGKPLPIKDIIKQLPDTHLAQPSGRWKEISLSDGCVQRPVGLEIDLGGVGKGMAADDIAEKFTSYSSWCVDLGGDLRFGGQGKRSVLIPSPFGDHQEIKFTEQAVATSGVWRRIWLQDGQPWHHLLDPSSGKPVWSQFAQATAFAPTVTQAERLAKQALLTGDSSVLEKGGLLLNWDGEWTYA